MKKYATTHEQDESLKKQFAAFLTNPSAKLTVELYETFRQQGYQIAHFNRDGYRKAVCRTLDGFLGLLKDLQRTDTGQRLLESAKPGAIVYATEQVARVEAATLNQEVEFLLYRANVLQSKFPNDLLALRKRG